MAPSNKSTEPATDDVDDLFNEDDFAGLDDLLDSVQEDDSEGWVPKEPGEHIVGIVTKLGEVRSDFADGDDALCPVVTVRTKDGTKWRVIGYGTVLKRELKDADPQVGDRIAIKYFGEKPNRNGKFAGKMSKRFAVAVDRKGA